MSIFPWNRSDDESLRSQLAELQRAHRELARTHEADCARFDQQIQIIWLAHPSWLRYEIQNAQATGWTVVVSRDAVVFHRLVEGEEHRHTVRMPLPDGPEADRIRQKLAMLIRTFEQAA
jgi:hypothetical protein